MQCVDEKGVIWGEVLDEEGGDVEAIHLHRVIFTKEIISFSLAIIMRQLYAYSTISSTLLLVTTLNRHFRPFMLNI